MSANAYSAGGPLGLETGSFRLAEVLATDPQTVPEFGAQLAEVDQHLDEAGLPQVKPFTEVYLTMTNSVGGSLDQFEDPQRLATLTCNFGRWFFDALRSHLKLIETPVPPAWEHLFGLTGQRLGPELAVHGVIAHIANDLPQAVRDAGMTEESRGDYFRVDQNIGFAARHLTQQHLPGPGVLKSGAARVSNRWATGLRVGAWENFQRLQNAAESEDPGALDEVVATIEQDALLASLSVARVGTIAVRSAALLRSVQPQQLIGR